MFEKVCKSSTLKIPKRSALRSQDSRKNQEKFHIQGSKIFHTQGSKKGEQKFPESRNLQIVKNSRLLLLQKFKLLHYQST